MSNNCQYCGLIHVSLGKCPSVKAFEYSCDGTLRRVEFFSPKDLWAGATAVGPDHPSPLRYHSHTTREDDNG